MDFFSPDLGLFFWQTIVLLVVLALLRRYAWESLLAFIEAQEAQHAKAMKHAEEARATTRKLQKVAEHIIAKAEEKEQRIIKRTEATQQALMDQTKEELKVFQEQQVQASKKQLAHEQAASLQALKGEIAQLAVQVATTQLQEELRDPARATQHLEALLKKRQEATSPTP